MCKNFFWGIADNSRKLIMKSWSSICSPKDEEGLGVKEIRSWNKALISKWIWLLDKTPVSIWCQWNKGYNFPHCSIWELSCKGHFSESFRSILSVKDALVSSVGSGSSARQLLDSWTKSGKFVAQSAYDWFRDKHPLQICYKAIARRTIVPKHGIITLLVIQKKLATVDSLQARGLVLINRCILCKNACESHSHLFFKCPFSREVWHGLLNWMHISGRTDNYIYELLWAKSRGSSRHWKNAWFSSCIAGAIYYLWGERNRRIFNATESTTAQLLHSIKFTVSTFLLNVTFPKPDLRIINSISVS
ncbi:uncharacterized protein LOC141638452 [Silene latifolia]|uniref:uncharacterized protein LOC141638452 n=1 Tax=Silene latifolia TaxID=37657 RepID=UPI003D76E867